MHALAGQRVQVDRQRGDEGCSQVRGRIDLFGLQNPVLDIAFRCHDDQQNPLFRQRQKFDVPEGLGFAPGRHHNAGKMGELRQQLGCRTNQFLWMIDIEIALKLVDFNEVQRLGGEQRVDEYPVAARRGYAAGRGVRAGDKAKILQVGHDVAYRRRGQIQTRVPGQRAGAHRLAFNDVAFDQGLEENLCATIKHEIHSTEKKRER